MIQEGSSLSLGFSGYKKKYSSYFGFCLYPCLLLVGGELADYIRLFGGFQILLQFSKQKLSSGIVCTHDSVLLIRKVGVFLSNLHLSFFYVKL